jgi:acyl carrier protein
MGNSDTLLPRVAIIIANTLMVDPATISRSTTAEDINGWDSVTHSMLILEIERELNIQLPVDRVFDVANVGELVDLIETAGRPA